MANISLKIPEEIEENLEKIAQDTDRTKSAVVRLAIKKFLEENGSPNK